MSVCTARRTENTRLSQAAKQAMEAQLVACVQESLALYLHDNARFMAERLLAEFSTEVCHAPCL